MTEPSTNAPTVIEKGYKSEVYLETRKVERDTGMVLQSTIVCLKGQETTAELLKMARRQKE
jgi:hypothetical protein